MEIFVPLLYDLVAVVLILITVSHSSMKGFAATFVSVLGHLASFFGALFISKAASKMAYSLVIKGEIMAFLREKVTGYGEINDILASFKDTFAELPKMAANILGASGFDEKAISTVLANSMNDGLQALEQTIIAPAVTGFLTMVLFTIMFFVFTILVRFMTKAVKIVFNIPILMPMDRFFGGAIGLVQSGVNLYLICIAARLFMALFGEMKYLNSIIIENTFIWKILYNFDPMPFLS